jgi:hypothetical protein
MAFTPRCSAADKPTNAASAESNDGVAALGRQPRSRAAMLARWTLAMPASAWAMLFRPWPLPTTLEIAAAGSTLPLMSPDSGDVGTPNACATFNVERSASNVA